MYMYFAGFIHCWWPSRSIFQVWQSRLTIVMLDLCAHWVLTMPHQLITRQDTSVYPDITVKSGRHYPTRVHLVLTVLIQVSSQSYSVVIFYCQIVIIQNFYENAANQGSFIICLSLWELRCSDKAILQCTEISTIIMYYNNGRSEERRVGEEGRSRWAPDH